MSPSLLLPRKKKKKRKTKKKRPTDQLIVYKPIS